MKILVSAMALAIALMWPALGEAQSKQRESARNTQQSSVQRHANGPCRTPIDGEAVRRTHLGRMSGWDPDPNVRSMIQMDAGRDDQ